MNNIPRIQPESNFQLMRTYAPGERDIIKECLEKARLKALEEKR